MKKVMHLLWDGFHGGVQRYVSKIAVSNYWQNYQHSVVIITDQGATLSENNCEVPVVSLGINANTEIIKCFKALSTYVKDNAIDIIHCHCDTLIFLSQLRLFKKQKLVYTEHGDSFVRKSRQFLTRFLWRCNGRLWDKIIQNSHFTENAFLNKFPFLNGKTAVAANPLLETVESQRRSISSETFNIGTVGRVEFVKGNDLLVKAAPQILRAVPHAHFHIFGDGSQKDTLVSLVKTLGIKHKFTFHGFTSSPLKAMQQLDCLAVPSRKESFGLVALEAMSVGTPVVAFKNTGVSDFLVDGHNGYLAAEGDLNSFAKAVQTMYQDKDNWIQMSTNAQLTVQENYSMEKHINNLEGIYDEMFVVEQQEEIA